MLNENQKWIEIASHSEVNVLIQGATGTGKSSLARQIHASSKRKDKPFIELNIATLHEGTLEATLFGYEKGAFTGAETSRVGRIELAHQGTLLIDEIGEMPLYLQARLLEFLQNRSFYPLGSKVLKKIDVRIIAATHRNLEKLVNEGKFREDLLHRLRAIEITLPSLKDLSDDFDSLFHKTLEVQAHKISRKVAGISESYATLLESYDWPGNFRELENVLAVSLLSLSENESNLTASHLPPWFIRRLENTNDPKLAASPLIDSGKLEISIQGDYLNWMKQVEGGFLRHHLARANGNLSLAARRLKMSKSTLFRRAKELEINV